MKVIEVMTCPKCGENAPKAEGCCTDGSPVYRCRTCLMEVLGNFGESIEKVPFTFNLKGNRVL